MTSDQGHRQSEGRAVPELPEALVTGRQAAHFAYFCDRLSARPNGVGARARELYAEACARPEALRFAPDEQPESVAAALERFLELGRRGEVRA